jgi:hypothetical protein
MNKPEAEKRIVFIQADILADQLKHFGLLEKEVVVNSSPAINHSLISRIDTILNVLIVFFT